MSTSASTELKEITGQLQDFPETGLDFQSEGLVIETLVDTTFALKTLYPELVSPVCLLLLREMGRLQAEKHENLIRSLLSIAPPDNETIMRAILEKKPIEDVFNWILENTEVDSETQTKLLSTFFRSVPYRDITTLIDIFDTLQGIYKDYVKQSIHTIRSRIISTLKPLVTKANETDAEKYIRILHLTGGKHVIPLIKKLLAKTKAEDLSSLKTALKTFADTGDQTFIDTISDYLDHNNASIRTIAVDLISGLGGPKAVQMLAMQAEEEALSTGEKKYVLTALASIKSEEADKTLKRFGRPFPFGMKEKKLRKLAQKLRSKEQC